MKLIAELHADAGSAKIFPAVFVGLAMGFVLVISVVSMSTLIFSGPTASFAIRGVGLPLFGTLVLCLTIALISGYRGVVSAQQDAPLAVVIGIVAAAGASMADAASETQFMTLVVIVILTTAVAGACILLLGQIRIANAFRFIPYPVVGGYLAGAGWVLVLASFSIMSGVVPTWETLPRLVEPATLWKWLIERLRPWLEAREYAAGETLMTRGEKQDGMRLIVEGEVSVVTEDEARLHQRGPGDALSSAAAFGDHRALAGAIADRRCRVMLLTPVARRVLENDDPHLALELDRYVISSFPS